jgi:hypothetical protein
LSEYLDRRISDVLPEDWREQYDEIVLTPRQDGAELFYGVEKDTGHKKQLKDGSSTIEQVVRENFGFEPTALKAQPIEDYPAGSWQAQHDENPELWDERVNSGRKLTQLYGANWNSVNRDTIAELEQKNYKLNERIEALEAAANQAAETHGQELTELEERLRRAIKAEIETVHHQAMEDLKQDYELQLKELRAELDKAKLSPLDRLRREEVGLEAEIGAVITPAAVEIIYEDYKRRLAEWQAANKDNPQGPASEVADVMRRQATHGYLSRLPQEDKQKLPVGTDQKLVRMLEINDKKETLGTKNPTVVLPPTPNDPPPPPVAGPGGPAGRGQFGRGVREDVVETGVVANSYDKATRVLAGLAAALALGAFIFDILEYAKKGPNEGRLRNEVAALSVNLNQFKSTDSSQLSQLRAKINDAYNQLHNQITSDSQADKQRDQKILHDVHVYGNKELNLLKGIKRGQEAARKAAAAQQSGNTNTSQSNKQQGKSNTETNNEYDINVDPGNGYTQEIQDAFPHHSGSEYFRAYQAALGRFGRNFISGVPKYRMADGNWGLGRPGPAQWTPAAKDFLKSYFSSSS